MDDLNTGDGGPDPSEFAPAARSSEAAAQRDGSDTRPSAGAPGAGVVTPEPKSPVVRSPPANGSPGSGKADSWDSKSPGTPGALGERASKPYDPFQETYEAYEARLRRQAEILDTSGFPIPPEEVSHRLSKAKFHAQAVEVAKGEQKSIIKELKKEFAVALLEVSADGRGQAKFRALSELLEEQGVALEEVKARLAQGVPLSTPTPPRDGGRIELLIKHEVLVKRDSK